VRRTCVLLAVLAAFVSPPSSAGAHNRPLSLMLDWTPNPDHVGFYYALDSGLFAREGLDVTIHAPADPTTPLKLVGAGSADLAVSYEQELFFARAKKLPVVAVAAVVPQPLNSVIAIESRIHSAADLKGTKIGITGVPSDYATLDTILRSVGLTRHDVHVVNVGYNLLPALLAHRVDAVLGAYRNVEGIQLQLRGLHPTIIPVDRAGVPNYDELVLVANRDRLRSEATYRTDVQHFVTAFIAGTEESRSHPAQALADMTKVTASPATFLARAVPATLRLLSGSEGVGCLSIPGWQRFGVWMHARGLLHSAIPATSVVDPAFLPRRCR
jgi:putative hydroxymethylpyrimidine transport system substrate-binding protein